MIYTITFNPALDKTVEIDNFSVGNVNRISNIRIDAGGKGINVSKVIKVLGGDSVAMGILAGKSGSFIKEWLDGTLIKNEFTFIAGETRTNLKVVDKINKTNTDINEPGPNLSSEAIEELWKGLAAKLNPSDLVVFSGSVPQGVDREIYGRWISRVKAKGARAILDADGELLGHGIKSAPYCIKPNIHELEGLFNKKISSPREAAEIGKILIGSGIEIVAVSMGSEGAVFLNKEKVLLAQGIKVNVESTVGAGDSMVAAIASAIDRRMDFEEAARLAVAAGTANVTTKGTEPADYETVMKYKKQVTLEYINMN